MNATRTRPTITTQNAGFEIADKTFVHQISWDSIILIEAYKPDLITTDLVCFDIQFTSDIGPLVITLDEEMEGFLTVETEFRRLPGFDAQWRKKVIQPAFAKNLACIFQRGITRASI